MGGYGAIEVQTSGDAKRPLLLWPVDGSSIRMNLDWDGSPHGARYLQVTDQSGPKSQITLDDDELIYIRLNPRERIRRLGWDGWKWRLKRSTRFWGAPVCITAGFELGGAVCAVAAGFDAGAS